MNKKTDAWATLTASAFPEDVNPERMEPRQASALSVARLQTVQASEPRREFTIESSTLASPDGRKQS